MNRTRRLTLARRDPRRRGAALLLALFLTVCLGAIAVSAIMMTSKIAVVTRISARVKPC